MMSYYSAHVKVTESIATRITNDTVAKAMILVACFGMRREESV